jgi:GT2 family glycosyltransferase
MKKREPGVSIVVLTHNQVEYTKRCFDRIGETTEDYQLVVVDNASTDGTVEYLQQFENDHQNVRVIYNRANLGFAGGCNLGVSSAAHGTICLLNNDTEPFPGWLEALKREFKPGVGAVGAKLLYPDMTIQHSGIVFHYRPQPFPHFAPDHRFENEPGDLPQANVIEEMAGCTAACLLTKKTYWHRVGGMDEGYVIANFEDVDFNLKLRDSGLKVIYQPEAVLIHHTHRTIDSKKGAHDDPMQYSQHNLHRLIDRWNDKLLAGMHSP